MINSTEVTSYEIASDNVLNQRLSFAYVQASKHVRGNMLEVGCGAGKGLQFFAQKCETYTALDKNDQLLSQLAAKYAAPKYKFISAFLPPFKNIPDQSIDSLVTLQVIEHIEDDHAFVAEMFRVMKQGSIAVVSTPNRPLSLSRNPWHVREYTANELKNLIGKYFKDFEVLGIKGNEKVMDYHEKNRQSVNKIMRFDIFNLQYRLPRRFLQVPYEILNRLNRNKLHQNNNGLVSTVTQADFSVSPSPEQCLDLYCIIRK